MTTYSLLHQSVDTVASNHRRIITAHNSPASLQVSDVVLEVDGEGADGEGADGGQFITNL